MVSSSFVVLAMAASVLAAQTEAHSYMTDPMPTWSVGYPTTNYAGLIDGQDYLPCPDGMSYGGTPEGNTDAYWTAFNASKYTSLKNLADKTMVLQSLNPFGKATAECGFSLPNGTARNLPAEVQWHDFGLSHQGPCEVWCDDKLAFMDQNCALNYPEVPASLPYDVDVCAGASMMQSYWIALHGLPWQLYLNCVPLTGKLNSTANNVAGDSDSAKTPYCDNVYCHGSSYFRYGGPNYVDHYDGRTGNHYYGCTRGYDSGGDPGDPGTDSGHPHSYGTYHSERRGFHRRKMQPPS